MNNNVFIFPIHVFLEDTDAGGIVYHANYIKYMERARSMWCVHIGLGMAKLAKENIFFVVKNIALDYLAPARLDDDLEVVTHIENWGRTSLTFAQQMRFAQQPEKNICHGKVVVVCINEKSKPIAIPQQFQQKFQEEVMKAQANH